MVNVTRSLLLSGYVSAMGLSLLLHAGESTAQTGSTAVRVVNTPLSVTVTNPGTPGSFLGPTKPSDLVTIRSSRAKCEPSPWLKLDTQITGDGTLVPFVIPARKVLVVTSIDFRQGATGSSGKQEEFFLFPSAANIGVNLAIVDLMAAPGSSDGRAGGSFVVTGVAIKAGNPCWGVNNLDSLGSADALVHGYLAADR
jgi:hypothetical protein